MSKNLKKKDIGGKNNSNGNNNKKDKTNTNEPKPPQPPQSATQTTTTQLPDHHFKTMPDEAGKRKFPPKILCLITHACLYVYSHAQTHFFFFGKHFHSFFCMITHTYSHLHSHDTNILC